MAVIPRRSLILTGVLGGWLIAGLASAQSVGDLIRAEEGRIEQAQEQQDQVDGIVSTTRSRFDEYQSLLREIEGLEVYNNLLQAQIDDQNRQLDELRFSIDQVSVIERQMLPLMTRMIDSLDQFVEFDMPFLLGERRRRVEGLRVLLNRSDVSAAEQFRNVMDAWQIEMSDYGRSSEIYTEVIMLDGAPREVQMLRIGRSALVYLTPDGQRAGAWDTAAREWVPLDNDYNVEIRAGIEAIRTGEPAQFIVPVAPPEEG
jgi:hypothetical protein